jgi:phage repressor protein C with HTH and peptisase S24 domain
VDVIRPEFCRFPPPPLLILVVDVNWRQRLRAAIERSGKKHSAIAREAGVAPATLSRILTAAHMHPTFDAVVRIAHAVNENVGWLLDERGFTLSGDEQKQLRKVVRFLDDTLLGTVAPRRDRPEPNAAPAGTIDIPRVYAVRGARLAYEAAGDSMIGAGIADRDLLYVKPTRSAREAAGKIVVCRIDTSEYVKVLDVRGGRTRLLSRNENYPPIDVENRLELIGIVVGRTGALAL